MNYFVKHFIVGQMWMHWQTGRNLKHEDSKRIHVDSRAHHCLATIIWEAPRYETKSLIKIRYGNQEIMGSKYRYPKILKLRAKNAEGGQGM